jgi:hypothetical protein
VRRDVTDVYLAAMQCCGRGEQEHTAADILKEATDKVSLILGLQYTTEDDPIFRFAEELRFASALPPVPPKYVKHWRVQEAEEAALKATETRGRTKSSQKSTGRGRGTASNEMGSPDLSKGPSEPIQHSRDEEFRISLEAEPSGARPVINPRNHPRSQADPLQPVKLHNTRGRPAEEETIMPPSETSLSGPRNTIPRALAQPLEDQAPEAPAQALQDPVLGGASVATSSSPKETTISPVGSQIPGPGTRAQILIDHVLRGSSVVIPASVGDSTLPARGSHNPIQATSTQSQQDDVSRDGSVVISADAKEEIMAALRNLLDDTLEFDLNHPEQGRFIDISEAIDDFLDLTEGEESEENDEDDEGWLNRFVELMDTIRALEPIESIE